MSNTGNILKRFTAKLLQALALACSVLLVCVPGFSQGSNTGRILGAITDQSGGAVAGATITVTDTQQGTTRTLTTDDAGEYNAPELIPGTYTVTGEFKGFKATERTEHRHRSRQGVSRRPHAPARRADREDHGNGSSPARGNHQRRSGRHHQ